MSMRIAIVDCGTNTFNLLVADAHRDGWKAVFSNKLAVKLGAGSFERNEITPSRYIRGIDALNCHKQNFINYSCEKVFAFATSAIRETMNGKRFVDDAKKLFDLNIEVIDGDREAELILNGIRQTIDLGATPSLAMDIGGGSIEFIIATQSETFWKKSYAIGVSRLYDLVQPPDRMDHESVSKLRSIIQSEMSEVKEQLERNPCRWLVGSSGSFDTLLDLFIFNQKEPKMTADPLCNEIPLNAFPSMHAWLMGSTLAERIQHPSIPPIRAEYMPLASYLIKSVLELHPFEKLFHSAYALKEGAIVSILNDIEWPVEDVVQKQFETEED